MHSKNNRFKSRRRQRVCWLFFFLWGFSAPSDKFQKNISYPVTTAWSHILNSVFTDRSGIRRCTIRAIDSISKIIHRKVSGAFSPFFSYSENIYWKQNVHFIFMYTVFLNMFLSDKCLASYIRDALRNSRRSPSKISFIVAQF